MYIDDRYVPRSGGGGGRQDRFGTITEKSGLVQRLIAWH